MGCICGRPSADAPESPRHEEALKQIQFQVRLYKLLQNGVLRKWCFEFKRTYVNEKEFWGQNFTTK